jgi:hypothetical protein
MGGHYLHWKPGYIAVSEAPYLIELAKNKLGFKL